MEEFIPKFLCESVEISLWTCITIQLGVFFFDKKKVLQDFKKYLGCLYLIYIIMEFSSPTFIFLLHQNKTGSMYEKMKEIFSKPPEIKFYTESYHYGKKIIKERDSNGALQDKEIDVRINSYRETYYLHYYSVKDVSGLLILDLDNAKNKNKTFIKLHLTSEINFADSISYSDYLTQKSSFWGKSKSRDTFREFKEERYIPGMKENNLFSITAERPPYFGASYYILFTFFPVAENYKNYINSFFIEQNFKVRKLISTRFNLLHYANVKKYDYLNPLLNLYNHTYSYERQYSGYVYNGYHVEYPSKDEIFMANQYSQYIPRYKVRTDGIYKGIVYDIPNFNNISYNVPPPDFI